MDFDVLDYHHFFDSFSDTHPESGLSDYGVDHADVFIT